MVWQLQLESKNVAVNRFTKKILNTTVNNLADALDLDYVALGIYKSAKN
jgi:hypothetical protein